MMLPKEKAKELFDTYYDLVPESGFSQTDIAKACALVAINEILYYQEIILGLFPSDGYQPTFWKDVKEEIENY